jgi:hypothetical protein
MPARSRRRPACVERAAGPDRGLQRQFPQAGLEMAVGIMPVVTAVTVIDHGRALSESGG